MATGPNPAPSCADAEGGRKTQPGCFCRSGQIMEAGKCINAEDCKCEYAGRRYEIGETYDKPEICLSCECTGSGEEECRAFECDTQCEDDEMEVSVEGECCTKCLAKWVEAVNPRPEATMNEPLALSCKVTGVEVTAGDIKWMQFPPEVDVTKLKKKYEISDDGLVLTIKSVNEKRVGSYKCVVTKDGKVSEGLFEVTIPIVHEDLIEPVQDTVKFIEGKDLVVEVRKLRGGITDLFWECNGVRMERKIINKKTSCKLVVEKATTEMAGSCTCFVKGVGSQDSAEIKIEAEANTVTVIPVKNDIMCAVGKECVIKCVVEKTVGKVSTEAMKVCRLVDDGTPTQCIQTIKKGKGKYNAGLGEVSTGTAGQYVCVHSEGGVDTVSVPTTVSVRA